MDRIPGSVQSATAATVAGATALAVVAAFAGLALAPALFASAPDGPGSEGERVAVTDVSGEQVVTVTYATGQNGTRTFSVRGVDPALANASAGWAYLPRSALPAPLGRADGNHTAGVVGVGRWALVGDLAATEADVDGVSVRVVAPAGMAVDPGRKLYFLEEFLSPYALGPPAAEEVTILIGPDALPSDGRMYDRRGYIAQHGFWDGETASVWVHEYVHARQGFRLTTRMRWFREASATYLSYRVMEEQYRDVEEADVYRRLTSTERYPDTALATRPAREGTRADYHRGARLLYAVDAAVRTGSDGNHTLVDVFRAMNHQEGRISVPEFVRIVEEHSGRREAWLRRAITEPGSFETRLGRARDVFG